jgi:hypothetical protein
MHRVCQTEQQDFQKSPQTIDSEMWVGVNVEIAGQSSGFPATGSSTTEVSQYILIENREKKFTSRKAAVSFVERGLAVWTSATSIRFLEAPEQFALRTARQDEHYWRAVAAQRGGEEVAFHWHPSISNGYVVMGATPVAIQKRAQLAHVGPER